MRRTNGFLRYQQTPDNVFGLQEYPLIPDDISFFRSFSPTTNHSYTPVTKRQHRRHRAKSRDHGFRLVAKPTLGDYQDIPMVETPQPQGLLQVLKAQQLTHSRNVPLSIFSSNINNRTIKRSNSVTKSQSGSFRKMPTRRIDLLQKRKKKIVQQNQTYGIKIRKMNLRYVKKSDNS